MMHRTLKITMEMIPGRKHEQRSEHLFDAAFEERTEDSIVPYVELVIFNGMLTLPEMTKLVSNDHFGKWLTEDQSQFQEPQMELRLRDPLTSTYPSQGCGGGLPYGSYHRARCGGHPGQVANLSPG